MFVQHLEGRLADISLGEEGASGLSDIVSHWQAQVAAADDRSRQAAAEHARETSNLRQAHARFCSAPYHSNILHPPLLSTCSWQQSIAPVAQLYATGYVLSTCQGHAEPLLLLLVIAAVVLVVTNKDRNAQTFYMMVVQFDLRRAHCGQVWSSAAESWRDGYAVRWQQSKTSMHQSWRAYMPVPTAAQRGDPQNQTLKWRP